MGMWISFARFRMRKSHENIREKQKGNFFSVCLCFFN